MIYGIGIDIIDVARLKESIEKNPSFAAKIFSPSEMAYCDKAAGNTRYERYAARFAAKEAFLKACGIGIGGGYTLTEIMVTHGENNRPGITLVGASNKIFERDINGTIHLSISHIRDLSQAMVTIEKSSTR
ncbi:MAG: holo-[acyl-carrier-protein] synthase [Candidatus Raymondbacteria bacterium RifOxyA12_full_50_37]|uniref:Holo-[acyl-carrier-protein] synthase n=1 Tax=Candidatus Raymondbacteria bacterium RIFOXYD12_FULL_49_13 TaxID=1817890 RepID=A0A1F7F0B2_UNCRA|nr:MAG: holo-[acyl-carrier-protein] synthase [Candidatus Raymondbacteria bacterium RifOxyB12_full_50_8]OGJ87215.1 MAG: holo-[acyl-carrier-protein] synthase [Candidatus Raymondbacteria bacterium RifOxyA12_full_50_37]OGJ88786.1 MAG: holo-[acyl-carrier-protein] synthase [Candidatus Raymondbacteria bacterium RIFOXYA2_FULL_49_16]OGJ96545.1 MAG: holo-[acyl-carrier-protein] synthase [Candidatus Raymondbacteria bacterium RIFOXYC2_FULL_50_21]OGJ99166.1 MAG: holo-[acyl-carrier-protein] synthase [Candidat